MSAISERGAGLLRVRTDGHGEVRPIELFFDLVYVLAVTQLTHHLLSHLSLRGAAETLLLLLAVWGAWINTTWITNYFELSLRPLRLVLIAIMFASLIMSAFLPEAFGDRGLSFSAALVAVLAGGTLIMVLAIGRGHHLGAVLERVLIWWLAIGVLWLAGGLADGELRFGIWLLAVALLYLAIMIGFPLPRLGRSRTTDYTIEGGHMAHRCLLFITLALGESILITGSNFGDLPSSTGTIAAFVFAFIGSVAFWWIYFDRGAEAGIEEISRAADPGRLGVSAYTYFHIPMVAGIIVAAAADEQTIAHPTDPATVTTTALILGGPVLFLAGHVLFKWAIWHYLSWPRLIAVGALCALVPVAIVSSALVLMVAATLILVGVAVWDAVVERALFPGVEIQHQDIPSELP